MWTASGVSIALHIFFSMEFFPWLKRMTSYAHTLRIWANLSIGICIYGWSEIFWIAIAKLWKTHQPTKALITLEAICVPWSLFTLFFIWSQWNQRCNREKIENLICTNWICIELMRGGKVRVGEAHSKGGYTQKQVTEVKCDRNWRLRIQCSPICKHT